MWTIYVYYILFEKEKNTQCVHRYIVDVSKTNHYTWARPRNRQVLIQRFRVPNATNRKSNVGFSRIIKYSLQNYEISIIAKLRDENDCKCVPYNITLTNCNIMCIYTVEILHIQLTYTSHPKFAIEIDRWKLCLFFQLN